MLLSAAREFVEFCEHLVQYLCAHATDALLNATAIKDL
jgi:hypothetical protein